MAIIYISKLDAAKRQLDTAINLFFKEADPVSIHTLAYNAHEILSTSAKIQSIQTLLKNNPFIVEEYKKEFHGLLSAAQNFFKHGKRDLKEILEFNPEITEYFLIDAVEIYMLLSEEKTPTMMAYRIWFLLKNPKFLSEQGKQLVSIATQYNPMNKPKFFGLIDVLTKVDLTQLSKMER